MKKHLLFFLSLCLVLPMQAQMIFITELHYDGLANDLLEYVEITGPSDMEDFACYQLLFVNGSNNEVYMKKSLAGLHFVQKNDEGFGTLLFSSSGLIQNGAPDGLILYDSCSKTAIQYLSYEGQMPAVAGYTTKPSTDIGVSENNTADNLSLQAWGSVGQTTNFSWEGPIDHSPDTLNSILEFPALGRGTVNGSLYVDNDRDCMKGASENALPNVAVSLVYLGEDSLPNTSDDEVLLSTLSNARGDYAFPHIIGGRYLLKTYPFPPYTVPYHDTIIDLTLPLTHLSFCFQPMISTDLTTPAKDARIQLFPQPSEDFLHIRLGGERGLQRIELRNEWGALVKAFFVNSTAEETVYDIQDLKSGYYLCTLFLEDKVRTLPFMKVLK